ncbi:MAG: hypothetical protein WBG70_08600 [Spirulinaceae cyanobacterium]
MVKRYRASSNFQPRKRRGRKVIRLTELTSVSTEQTRQDKEKSILVRNYDHKPQKKGGFWRLLVFWFNVLLIVGGSASLGILWLTKLPPQVDCRELSPLAADSDRLFCVQKRAESGELASLAKAINLVAPWQENHPLYPEAQRLLGTWSGEVLQMAQGKISRGKFEAAVKTAKKIPVTSPLYPEARAAIAAWEHQWQLGKEIIAQFENALKNQNWQQATQLLPELSQLKMKYWQEVGIDELMVRLTKEKSAWQQLQDAQEIAKPNTPQALGEGIALIGKIGTQTYAKAEGERVQSIWGRKLLTTAGELVNQQKFVEAIAVASYIPGDSKLYPEAEDWIVLSQASQAAQKQNMITYLDALSGLEKIDSQSPIYEKAQQKASQWQGQLQDKMQLRLARTTAQLGYQPSLDLAVAQAQKIEPGSPGRIEAQTWIAKWGKDLAFIEDRFLLAEAKKIAVGGNTDALKGAIAKAQGIVKGRPLRIEAQTWIAWWDKEIKILEDQPTLDLAKGFAQRGELATAIETVQKISSNRPLYPEAQSLAVQWSQEIKEAQDREILQTAAILAQQGDLKGAIAQATAIPANRPLYQEAQIAIAAWKLQLQKEKP